MSVKAHRTTGAQTTEPGHHNGEFVNDVQVSPIDEGAGVVEEDELSRAARRPPDCSQRISSVVTPNSWKSTSFQSKPRSPSTQRASRGQRALGGPPAS